MGHLVFTALCTSVSMKASLALNPFTFVHLVGPVLGRGAPYCIHYFKAVPSFDFNEKKCDHTRGLPAALKTGCPCLTALRPC